MKRILSILLGQLFWLTALAQPDWSVDPGSYQYSMTVTTLLQVDGNVLQGEGDRIGAFSGDEEVRGVASPSVYVPSIDRYVAFLTVFSNSVSGEEIYFKLYSAESGSEISAVQTINFSDGGQVGGNVDPFVVENLVLNISPNEIADVPALSGPFTISLSSNHPSETQLSLEVLSGPAEISRVGESNEFQVQNQGIGGLVTLQASAPGGAYYPGVTTQVDFEVLKLDQEIVLDTIPGKTFGDGSFEVSVSASSELPVELAVVTGPVSVSGNVVTIAGAGEVTISANQEGNDTYYPAEEVIRTFSIGKASQSVIFEPGEVPNKLVDDDPFSISLASESGSPVELTAAGPVTISSTGTNEFLVTMTGETGNVALMANVPESDNYLGASANVTFLVSDPSKEDQQISFEPISDKVYGDEPFSLSALASSGLEVGFEVISGPVSLDSGILTILAAGQVIVQASQPGNEIYNPAEFVVDTFLINKAEQEITFDPASIGNKLVIDDDFNISVSATSDGAVLLEAMGPSTLTHISENQYSVSLTGQTGTVTINATAEATVNYLGATASISFIVFDPSKTDQTISFDPIPNKTFGASPFNLTVSSSSGLEVELSVVSGPITIDGKQVTITGAGEAVIVAQQPGDDTFNPAPETTRTFIIAKASQSISFALITEVYEGAEDIALVATATSGLPISFSSSDETVAEVSPGNVLKVKSAGSTTVSASQSGNENYLSATAVEVVLKVLPLLNVSASERLSAYPNPVVAELRVEGFDSSKESFYELVTLAGKRVKYGMISSEIDMYGLPTGTYILKLRTGSEQSFFRVLKK